MTRLVIIGGGAWGTALTLVARRAGSKVVLWARDDNVVAAINEWHENPLLLPGIALDPEIVATSSIDAAMDGAEAALLVVPAQFLRGVIGALRPGLPDGTPVLHCAKGIEAGSLKTMSEVCVELLPIRLTPCCRDQPSPPRLPAACRRRLRSPAMTGRWRAASERRSGVTGSGPIYRAIPPEPK